MCVRRGRKRWNVGRACVFRFRFALNLVSSRFVFVSDPLCVFQLARSDRICACVCMCVFVACRFYLIGKTVSTNEQAVFVAACCEYLLSTAPCFFLRRLARHRHSMSHHRCRENHELTRRRVNYAGGQWTCDLVSCCGATLRSHTRSHTQTFVCSVRLLVVRQRRVARVINSRFPTLSAWEASRRPPST